MEMKLTPELKANLMGYIGRGASDFAIDDNGHLIVTMSDGSKDDLGRVKGDTGATIVSIEQTAQVGNKTIYTITLSDEQTFEFEVEAAVGPQGEVGPQGPAGPQGETGPAGPQGVPGPQGPKGEQGEQGSEGPVGPQGEQGIQGEQGEDGYSPSITVTTIANGHRVTITDANGTKSFDVMNGTGGGSGSGENGVTFYPTVDADGNISWTNDGGLTNPTTVNIKGPAGPQGEQGPQGETGPAGADGAKGDKGDKGDPGADGTPATHSWNGTTLTVTSASGTSSANLKGEKGDKGDTGETGPEGPQGEQGIQGIQGLQGEQGPKGDTGETGADGVGIQSVTQTTTSTEDGGTNVITVIKTDNTASTFTVKNGTKGSQGEKGEAGSATQYTVTIPSEGWMQTAYGYMVKDVSVPGLVSDYNIPPDIDVVLSLSDLDADKELIAAFGLISAATTRTDVLSVYCAGSTPSINVPIVLRVWE